MKALAKFAVITIIAAFAAQAHAQTLSLVTDTFTYPDGVLPSPWTLYSGTGGINALGGQATITGGSPGGGDMGLPIGSIHSSDNIFAAFDATVVSWAQSGTPAYFALFKDASTFNFFARTFVTNVVGGVQFGIQTGNLLPVTVWSPTVTLGSTHRVTIGLDQTGTFGGVNMAASLWLDGSFVGTASSIINSNYAISQFALRQSNATTMGTIQVDNLDVYNVIPEPSTIMLMGVGMVGLLALRRRK